MNKRINMLVLGVGGNVSQGIIKALRLGKLNYNIIGACVDSYAAGLYMADKSYISPYANNPDFINWLVSLCIKEEIDVIMSGVEEVLVELSKNTFIIKEKTNAIAIVSDITKFEIALNKYETCKWLEKNNLNFPEYAMSNNKEEVYKLFNKYKYNLIAKPINGKGSVGIIKIKSEKDLEKLFEIDDYVVEELIGTEDEEFTVGCYCDRNSNTLEPIVMKRNLLNGTTIRVEIGEFNNVREEAIKIIEKFLPKGPCNIQMRIKNGKPCCFEINLRFSGTTPIRANYGYNDVELSIKDFYLLEENLYLPIIKNGIALRYYNEIYISNNDICKLGNLEL